MLFKNLVPQQKGSTPEWYQDYSYLTLMGSRAYGTQNENSDYDFYGFTVPPIQVIFPHLKGEIPGFGRNVQRFEQMQFQDVHHPSYESGYDITIYSIVRYFQLVMEGNPNMVDSLFSDYAHCEMDEVGKLVKDNRRLFLSQKCYHTFKGMMWSHLSRLKSGHTKEGRKENELKYGWDTKDGYHSLRMALEVQDLMTTGDMDLRAHKEILLRVRNGELPKEHVLNSCELILNNLESNQDKFVLPYSPNERSIKDLLINCLDLKYGKLSEGMYGFGVKA